LRERGAVLLTHDVDKIIESRSHIWKVRKRFSLGDLVRGLLNPKHLYRNVEDIMALEDEHGVRSTFFLAVDLYDIGEIEDVVKQLAREGWEVALHLVYTEELKRSHDPALVKERLKRLERATGKKVLGSRSHYLVHFGEKTWRMLKSAGLAYDSTLRPEEVGGYKPVELLEGFYELPLTVMDSDLWGLWKLSEAEGWKHMVEKLYEATKEPDGVFVLNAHQESFHMRGGRLYKKFLAKVVEENFEIMTCAEYLEKLRKEGGP